MSQPPPMPRREALGGRQTPELRGQEYARHPAEVLKLLAKAAVEVRNMVDLAFVLAYRFSPREDVYVGIDQFVYNSEGMEPERVTLGVFVSFDVPSYRREVYRIAEEGKPPDWIIEVASPSAYKYDVEGKKDLYEGMGVREYWMYDPQGGMHDPRLRAWLLAPGGYEELADLKRSGLMVALWSEALGLEFHFGGTDLRMRDPAKQSHWLTLGETQAELEILKAETAAHEAEIAAMKAQIETAQRTR